MDFKSAGEPIAPPPIDDFPFKEMPKINNVWSSASVGYKFQIPTDFYALQQVLNDRFSDICRAEYSPTSQASNILISFVADCSIEEAIHRVSQVTPHNSMTIPENQKSKAFERSPISIPRGKGFKPIKMSTRIFSTSNVSTMGCRSEHDAKLVTLMVGRMLKAVGVPIMHVSGFRVLSFSANMELINDVDLSSMISRYGNIYMGPLQKSNHLFPKLCELYEIPLETGMAMTPDQVSSLFPFVSFDPDRGNPGLTIKFFKKSPETESAAAAAVADKKLCHVTVFSSGKIGFKGAAKNRDIIYGISRFVQSMVSDFRRPKTYGNSSMSEGGGSGGGGGGGRNSRKIIYSFPKFPSLCPKQQYLQKFSIMQSIYDWQNDLFGKNLFTTVKDDAMSIHRFLLLFRAAVKPNEIYRFTSAELKNWTECIAHKLTTLGVTWKDSRLADFQAFQKYYLSHFTFHATRELCTSAEWECKLFGNHHHHITPDKAAHVAYRVPWEMNITLPCYLFLAAHSTVTDRNQPITSEKYRTDVESLRKHLYNNPLFTWDNYIRPQQHPPVSPSPHLAQLFVYNDDIN